jgi:hypothetical protein
MGTATGGFSCCPFGHFYCLIVYPRKTPASCHSPKAPNLLSALSIFWAIGRGPAWSYQSSVQKPYPGPIVICIRSQWDRLVIAQEQIRVFRQLGSAELESTSQIIRILNLVRFLPPLHLLAPLDPARAARFPTVVPPAQLSSQALRHKFSFYPTIPSVTSTPEFHQRLASHCS